MSDLNINIYKLGTGQHVVCFFDPMTGKRVRKKFRTQVAAKEHQRALELKYKVKGLQGFVSEPIGRLMQLHLEKSPNSRVTQRKNSFTSFCDAFGNRKISEIGKTEVHGWLLDYQAKNKLSDRTMNGIKTQFNYFFKYLKDEGIIQQSPLDEIKFKRNPTAVRPRIVFSIEEVKTLLENAKTFSPDYLYPYLYTVANTGARRKEVLNVRREDVDFNTGLLNFRKTKNGEDRAVRMSSQLSSLLKEHLGRHTSDFVFENPEGREIGRSQLQRLIDKFKVFFPSEKDWGCHALRHSFAYNFLKKGGEMYQLQAILGHKHIQVTVDLYGQLQAQDVEKISPYED